MLKKLLDRPIAYHRSLVPIGGVTGAVMLSQAIYWSKRIPDDRDGWFYKTGVEWTDETGLTRREQESARKKLKKAGVLEENLQGNPAKLWYKVNYEKLEDLLKSLYKQVSTKPPNKNGGNRQTIYTESTSYITQKKSPLKEEPSSDGTIRFINNPLLKSSRGGLAKVARGGLAKVASPTSKSCESGKGGYIKSLQVEKNPKPLQANNKINNNNIKNFSSSKKEPFIKESPEPTLGPAFNEHYAKKAERKARKKLGKNAPQWKIDKEIEKERVTITREYKKATSPYPTLESITPEVLKEIAKDHKISLLDVKTAFGKIGARVRSGEKELWINVREQVNEWILNGLGNEWITEKKTIDQLVEEQYGKAQ